MLLLASSRGGGKPDLPRHCCLAAGSPERYGKTCPTTCKDGRARRFRYGPVGTGLNLKVSGSWSAANQQASSVAGDASPDGDPSRLCRPRLFRPAAFRPGLRGHRPDRRSWPSSTCWASPRTGRSPQSPRRCTSSSWPTMSVAWPPCSIAGQPTRKASRSCSCSTKRWRRSARPSSEAKADRGGPPNW